MRSSGNVTIAHMDLKTLIVDLVKQAKLRTGVFETRKIEFKERYELIQGNGKINKAVQAELIRDISSIANSSSDPEFDTGIIILGVSRDGEIVGKYSLPLKDKALLEELVNGVLERPIKFSYREYDIGKKRVGAIIIARSNAVPHIVRHNLSSNQDTYLRVGECWVRREGHKRLAMASDYDEMYEYLASVDRFSRRKSHKKFASKIRDKSAKKQFSKIHDILELPTDSFNEKVKKLMSK